MMAAQYLDEKTVLSKLPFISVDEVDSIINENARETADRFSAEDEGEGGEE